MFWRARWVNGMDSGLIRLSLDALYYSGVSSVLSPLCQSAGVIFTLHHVRPASGDGFQPNSILEVTPEFLDGVIGQVRAGGFDIVSLDEARRRLVAPGNDRRFVCFTFDDGYRDNRDFAYPVLRRHNCPFAVFVTTGFCDRTGELWWVALEEAIRGTDRLIVPEKDGTTEYATGSDGEKQSAFNDIYQWLRATGEERQRTVVRAIAARAGIDMGELCERLVLGWEELRAFAGEPLLTVGAHTMNHFALARLSETQARAEMAGSVRRIGKELGQAPRHFAYPYGDPGSAGRREFHLATELGLDLAVTTRKGAVFAEHRDHLAALPRVSLNGDYQSARYVELFLSGTPFLLWNGFRRLDVA